MRAFGLMFRCDAAVLLALAAYLFAATAAATELKATDRAAAPRTDAALSAADSEKKSPPNIVLILTDDQRFDTIAALGNREIRTPRIDRLVERGFAFTNAYIMGGTQPAVCVPSRAMLHSGLGLWRARDDLQGQTTLGEVLRGAGYATYAVGKWHNKAPSLIRGYDKARAIFLGGMSDQYRVPLRDLTDEGKLSEPRIVERHSTELFCDAAIELLGAHRGPKPFFLYLALTSPHDPRTAPAEFARMYDRTKIELPKNFLPEHPFDNGELRIRDELLAPFPRPADEIRRHIADYYAMISHLDHEIGRVLDALDASGCGKNTIVIFAGDNGLAVGQHGLMGKQNLYEHSIRVPLIVAGSGIRTGRSDSPVYLHDLFATVCDWAGAKTPQCDAESLRPLIDGTSTEGRKQIVAGYRQWQRAVRQGQFKLIEYRVQGARYTQLFDLAADPWEMENLAPRPEHAQRIAQMRTLLADELRKAGDPVEFPLDAAD